MRITRRQLVQIIREEVTSEGLSRATFMRREKMIKALFAEIGGDPQKDSDYREFNEKITDVMNEYDRALRGAGESLGRFIAGVERSRRRS
jgi:hypothetical protein